MAVWLAPSACAPRTQKTGSRVDLAYTQGACVTRTRQRCVHVTEGGELSGGPRTSFVEGTAASAEAPLSPNWRWIPPAHPGYQHLRASARKSVSVCTQDRTDALQIVIKRNSSALTFRAAATSNSTTTPARLGPAAVTLLSCIVAATFPPSCVPLRRVAVFQDRPTWGHIRFNPSRRKRERERERGKREQKKRELGLPTLNIIIITHTITPRLLPSQCKLRPF